MAGEFELPEELGLDGALEEHVTSRFAARRGGRLAGNGGSDHLIHD
jgi:hypothetical protein